MYEEIDKVLGPWLKKNALHVFTEDRGCEIRSSYVVDDVRDTYRIDVSFPDPKTGRVSIWLSTVTERTKLKRKSETFETPLPELAMTLDAAFKRISDWIRESGHTRSPVA